MAIPRSSVKRVMIPETNRAPYWAPLRSSTGMAIVAPFGSRFPSDIA